MTKSCSLTLKSLSISTRHIAKHNTLFWEHNKHIFFFLNVCNTVLNCFVSLLQTMVAVHPGLPGWLFHVCRWRVWFRNPRDIFFFPAVPTRGVKCFGEGTSSGFRDSLSFQRLLGSDVRAASWFHWLVPVRYVGTNHLSKLSATRTV